MIHIDRIGMADSVRSIDAVEASRDTSRDASTLRRVRVIGDLLDNALRIPGTDIRVGLDPLIGLVPGLGDLIGGLASAYIVLEAARAGAPTSVLTRMLANVGIDSIVGSVPVAGDLFDVAWKSNARNVRLLERHLDAPGQTRRASIALAYLLIAAVLLLAAGGVVLTVLLVRRLVG